MSDRIKIINATADDFAIEVVSTVPANGSVGDHANGRLVKYGTHMYVWCNHQGIWAKFANTSDFTSLETRLSQQEDKNSSDITSLENVDLSLETRISEEESEMVSAVTSEELRASSVQQSLEERISSLTLDREEHVSLETSLQQSLTTGVESTLASMIEARTSSVDSLEERATSVENSLSDRIALQELTSDSLDASLTTRANSAETDKDTGDANLISAIVSSESQRVLKDSSLETYVVNQEGTISAILLAADADKDSFTEIVSIINSNSLEQSSEMSLEFKSLEEMLESAETALIATNSSLESRISSEETFRETVDSSLTIRTNEETNARETADDSLTARMSNGESDRISKDNSLETMIASVETALIDNDASLESKVVNAELDRGSADTSLEVFATSVEVNLNVADVSLEDKISVEEASMEDALGSLETARILADSNLSDSISVEEASRESKDSEIEANLSSMEDTLTDTDSSLQVRIASEESVLSSDTSSLEESLVSTEASLAEVDSSLELSIETAINIEQDRVSAMLAGAAADPDTFVEIVSFITEFDLGADDQLASYESNLDSRILAEEQTMAATDLSLENLITDKISDRISAITSLENKQSGEISTLASSVDSLETREETRHLRIDFSNKTSFTVLQTDLPSGFTPGNGLVQVYQEVTSNTYRRLVSPMNFDPTTGEMTFDLGVSPKSGFAVFYSFAGDETDLSSSSGQQAAPPPPSSSSSSYPDFVITGATMSHGALQGDSSSVTFNTTGVTAANLDSFLQYSGDTFYLGVGGQRTFNYYDIHQNRYGVSFDWAVDYSSFTISWENVNNALTYSEPAAPSGDAHIASLYFGHGSDRAYFKVVFRFDSVTGALVPSAGTAGEYIDNGDTLYLSPPYMVGSGTATYTANVDQGTYNVRRNVYRYLRGPQWEIPLGNLTEHLVINQATTNNVKNYVSQTGSYTSSYGNISWESQNMFFDTFGGAWGITVTNGGTDYYSVGTKLNSSHHLWSEVTTNRTLTSSIDRMSANVNPTNETVAFSYSDGSYSSTTNPDADSIVTLYLAAGLGYGMELINDTHLANTNTTYNWGANTSYATDIKIVIDTSDQSYEIYRNSNVGGSPTWVAVDRAYLSNQEVN